ncbi:MAG: hypothetical protein HQL31_04710, partial [Planctomycetes bacterium]|nr:hypothetical protein [Planctomycetota bacterium]
AEDAELYEDHPFRRLETVRGRPVLLVDPLGGKMADRLGSPILANHLRIHRYEADLRDGVPGTQPLFDHPAVLAWAERTPAYTPVGFTWQSSDPRYCHLLGLGVLRPRVWGEVALLRASGMSNLFSSNVGSFELDGFVRELVLDGQKLDLQGGRYFEGEDRVWRPSSAKVKSGSALMGPENCGPIEEFLRRDFCITYGTRIPARQQLLRDCALRLRRALFGGSGLPLGEGDFIFPDEEVRKFSGGRILIGGPADNLSTANLGKEALSVLADLRGSLKEKNARKFPLVGSAMLSPTGDLIIEGTDDFYRALERLPMAVDYQLWAPSEEGIRPVLGGRYDGEWKLAASREF